jgi:hypothetical protein
MRMLRVAEAPRVNSVNREKCRLRWLLLFLIIIIVCFNITLQAQSLSPTSRNFGQLAVGFSSSFNISLANGKTPLEITSITTTVDFAQTSTCPLSPQILAASAKCTITVTFSPAVLGTVQGMLTVTYKASGTPLTAQLTGTGIAPVSLSPANLGMGSEFVNTTSAAKAVTLKNNQPTLLTIASISTSANFGQTSNCPLSPNSLAANGSCTISVTFTPTTQGTIAGSLTVSDTASNSQQTVPLTGAGVLPVTLSVSSLNFPSQLVTTTSASQSVTMKNG